jgi:hypothetical protein
MYVCVCVCVCVFAIRVKGIDCTFDEKRVCMYVCMYAYIYALCWAGEVLWAREAIKQYRITVTQ